MVAIEKSGALSAGHQRTIDEKQIRFIHSKQFVMVENAKRKQTPRKNHSQEEVALLFVCNINRPMPPVKLFL
jgi:hypothetical protein